MTEEQAVFFRNIPAEHLDSVHELLLAEFEPSILTLIDNPSHYNLLSFDGKIDYLAETANRLRGDILPFSEAYYLLNVYCWLIQKECCGGDIIWYFRYCPNPKLVNKELVLVYLEIASDMNKKLQ